MKSASPSFRGGKMFQMVLSIRSIEPSSNLSLEFEEERKEILKIHRGARAYLSFLKITYFP